LRIGSKNARRGPPARTCGARDCRGTRAARSIRAGATAFARPHTACHRRAVVPPRCLACGGFMESCDPSRRVHRTCLRTWPERERYLRERLTAWATRAPAPCDPTASHLLYRTEAIAAVISVLVDDDVLRGREWVENVLVEVAHVDALDQRSFPPAEPATGPGSRRYPHLRSQVPLPALAPRLVRSCLIQRTHAATDTVAGAQRVGSRFAGVRGAIPLKRSTR
jgi:hypothetical protein